jgi:hypothetical protein
VADFRTSWRRDGGSATNAGIARDHGGGLAYAMDTLRSSPGISWSGYLLS